MLTSTSPFKLNLAFNSPDAAYRTPRARDKTPSVAVAVAVRLPYPWTLTLLHINMVLVRDARLRVRGGVKTAKDATRSISRIYIENTRKVKHRRQEPVVLVSCRCRQSARPLTSSCRLSVHQSVSKILLTCTVL